MVSGWKYSWALAGSAIAAITAATPSAYAQGVVPIDFALPAQPLASALREIAVRSGTDIVAATEAVSGRQAPALRGRFTPEEALRQLLAGSGLQLRRVGAGFVVVSPEGVRTALADDGADASQIVVTGTNVRGAKPTSKVIVVSRDDIDKSGATSVDQLMRTVPQNTQGGTNKENSLVARPDSSTTDHGAGLNLRGLGQRATLVLLNGRRLAPSGTGAFVDVSLIPVTALERVEILTDGASAIYGSDAVGGVVNLILRDRYDGAETALQAGVTTQGGGELLQVSQAFGQDWGSGHGLLSYEYRREEEIKVMQRDEPIGLRPGTFLLPRERRHSILAALGQDLVPGLSFDFTGTMARRTTERTDVPVLSNLPIGVAPSRRTGRRGTSGDTIMHTSFAAQLGALELGHLTVQRPENTSAECLPGEAVEQTLAAVWSDLFALFPDTALEDDAEEIAWGLVNLFHRASAKRSSQIDRATDEIRCLIASADGSEVHATELEKQVERARCAEAAMLGLEEFREAAAALYLNETGSSWRPAGGSRLNHGKTLTSAVVDGREFLRARAESRRRATLPEGTPVVFAGGRLTFATTDDAKTCGENVWATLDKVRERVADMVLVHGGDGKGLDRIAASWAERRKVVQVTFALDPRLAKRAGFKRNEQMIALKPRYVIAFAGNGVLERLVIDARQAGISVVDRRGPLGTNPKRAACERAAEST